MKRRIIIKIGGSILDEDGVLHDLAQEIKAFDSDQIVVVHGGGKAIGRTLNSMGKKYEFIDGLRVTDEESIDVIERVLSGTVNKRIVRMFHAGGLKAVGLSGVDGALLRAEKMSCDKGDLGFVGEIQEVYIEFLEIMLNHGFIPVISPISLGFDMCVYNVNADHAAAKIAIASQSNDLIFITDVPGILVDGRVQPLILIKDVDNLISEHHIKEGMVPKIRSAAHCVMEGVERVHIIGWKGSGSLKDTLDGSQEWGTILTN